MARLLRTVLEYRSMEKRTKFGTSLRTSVCAGVIALALLVASSGLAQSTTSQKPAPESPAPTLRVTSRLVQVSVIVRHKGAPVTGLTKDDFTVLDQNRPQQIADFSEQSYEPRAAAKSTGTPQNSSGIFSNHFDSGSGMPTSKGLDVELEKIA